MQTPTRAHGPTVTHTEQGSEPANPPGQAGGEGRRATGRPGSPTSSHGPPRPPLGAPTSGSGDPLSCLRAPHPARRMPRPPCARQPAGQPRGGVQGSVPPPARPPNPLQPPPRARRPRYSPVEGELFPPVTVTVAALASRAGFRHPCDQARCPQQRWRRGRGLRGGWDGAGPAGTCDPGSGAPAAGLQCGRL